MFYFVLFLFFICIFNEIKLKSFTEIIGEFIIFTTLPSSDNLYSDTGWIEENCRHANLICLLKLISLHLCQYITDELSLISYNQ